MFQMDIKTTQVLSSVMVSVSVKKRNYEIPREFFFLILLYTTFFFIIKYNLYFYNEYLEV